MDPAKNQKCKLCHPLSLPSTRHPTSNRACCGIVSSNSSHRINTYSNPRLTYFVIEQHPFLFDNLCCNSIVPSPPAPVTLFTSPSQLNPSSPPTGPTIQRITSHGGSPSCCSHPAQASAGDSSNILSSLIFLTSPILSITTSNSAPRHS
jgi:hypothetical protein